MVFVLATVMILKGKTEIFHAIRLEINKGCIPSGLHPLF